MRDLHGPAGDAWLQRLPAIVADSAERWSLEPGSPFPLTFNYVLPATRAGQPVVLKIGLPNREFLNEMEALALFDGHGMARLLEADREQGAMLLEAVVPGTPLATLPDDEAATVIAGETMRALWRPAPEEHAFPTVSEWAQGLGRLRSRFAGGTGPLPEPMVARAESLFAELLRSTAAPRLLHGDLHHDNILLAQERGREEWLAIDPKGLVGDPGFDVGALMQNPMPGLIERPGLKSILARRLDILSEILGIDRERLWAWSLAHAVLSAWWNVEDFGAGWEYGITIAEALADLGDGGIYR